MIVLVGGSGFIGMHVRDLLARRGERVLVVTRNLSRRRTMEHEREVHITPEMFDQNPRQWLEHARAVVYLNTSSVPSTFAGEPWQEVPHNVLPATTFFLKYGPLNSKAKWILISSGGTIYGNAGTPSVDEGMPPAPVSAYGLGKLMIEEAVRFAGRTLGLPYNILRVSNPVGRHHRNPKQGIFQVAIRAAQTGAPFTVFGGGTNVRDYIDADDVAEAIVQACHDQRFNSATWNVGSGLGLSVNDVVNLVEQVSSRRLDIRHEPARQIDVDKIILNCHKIENELGWKAWRPLAETVNDICRALNFV